MSLKTLYHATPYENVAKILIAGGILPSSDGNVYLAETPEDAIRFIMPYYLCNIQGHDGSGSGCLVALPVVVDENKLSESSDHNEKFWGCKAYIHDGKIENDHIMYKEMLSCAVGNKEE